DRHGHPAGAKPGGAGPPRRALRLVQFRPRGAVRRHRAAGRALLGLAVTPAAAVSASVSACSVAGGVCPKKRNAAFWPRPGRHFPAGRYAMKNNHLNDTPFFRAMGFVGDVFLLNLCWLLGCVLIVTIGASTSAAFSVAGKMAAKQDYRVFHDYFAAFKRDFKLATLAWLAMAVAGVLIFATYQIGLAHAGTLSNLLIAAGAALGVVWLC